MLSRKYRSVSPLIATILLIVVSVILVTVVITWGSNFTSSSLQKTADLLSEDPQLTGFIFVNQFNYNIFTIKNSSNRSVTFVGYEIISNEDLNLVNTRLNFTSPISLSGGSTSQLPLICVPASSFSLNLITDTGTYVPVNLNNITGSIPDSCRMEVVGNGSESDPYKIYNVFQLNDVRNYLDIEDINFTLEKNIDFDWISLSDFSDVSGFEDYDLNGWDPIGNSYNWLEGGLFYGNFDGKNNIIRNLYIYRPERVNSYTSLFDTLRNSELKNIGLVDVNVTGRNEASSLIGNIINSKILYSYAIGQVTSIGNSGGLVSYFGNDSNIIGCFFLGSVSGANSAGGLMPFTTSNNSSIINSYAIGSVSGDWLVGGLIGSLEPDYAPVNIINSYAISSVSGSTHVGGLQGINWGADIFNSYWNTDVYPTSNGGEGKTTEQMKQKATYVGWDFDTVWQIQEGITYPYLRSNPQSPPPE